MKLGILLAGRRPGDIGLRLAQARQAGFSLCQLNLMQSGFTRNDLLFITDNMIELGMRPVAIGCYVNPLRPDDPSFMGTCRADLDLLLHSLDVLGARKVVIWSGSHAANAYESHPENRTEESRSSLRDFCIEIVRGTRARHFTLVIEPCKSHVLGCEQSVLDFHAELPLDVAERVRYVLDVPDLLTPERYGERDKAVKTICQSMGELTGLIHLRDMVVSPEGEESYAAPAQGGLDYPDYVDALFRCASPDAAAIVRNVPQPEYAAVRDALLQLSDRWELV